MGTAKRIFASLFLLLPLFVSPSVRAENTARVVISEVQTESSTDANLEFVEIVNVSGDTVDLSGWTVQYRAATGTTWTSKATLNGQLYPNGSIVIATQGYLVDSASYFWSQSGGVLASTGGNIRLLPANSITAEDTVAWGTGVYGETSASTKAQKGSSIQRKSGSGALQDTNNNNSDFEILSPTPLNRNIAPTIVVIPEPIVVPDVQVPDETPAVVDPIPINTAETPIPVETVVAEPTPDPPTDPQTAVIPEVVPPNTDTVVEPPAVTPESEPPSEHVVPPADTTQGITQPEIVVPAPIVQIPAEVVETPAQLPPIINELMMNPGSPLTDADDEWVELYNPGDSVFVLTGYKLQSGTTFSHSYTFTNESIEPHGYLTLYSSQSGLALSNTSGAVRLLDASGAVVAGSVIYDETEENNTYALGSDGLWTWTTTPTPSASNVFTSPIELIPALTTKTTTTKTVKTPARTTAKIVSPKTTIVKAATASSVKKASTASTKSAKSTTPKSATTRTSQKAAAPTQAPSHPVALAGFGLLAVGYALYEYREDISNKLRLARRYASARRKNSPSL